MIKQYQNKEGEIVLTSDRFVYTEEIFKRTPKSYCLIRSKTFACDRPIIRSCKQKQSQDYKYNPETQVAIVRELELIAAPEQYLIDNKYFRKNERNRNL